MRSSDTMLSRGLLLLRVSTEGLSSGGVNKFPCLVFLV